MGLNCVFSIYTHISGAQNTHSGGNKWSQLHGLTGGHCTVFHCDHSGVPHLSQLLLLHLYNGYGDNPSLSGSGEEEINGKPVKELRYEIRCSCLLRICCLLSRSVLSDSLQPHGL